MNLNGNLCGNLVVKTWIMKTCGNLVVKTWIMKTCVETWS